MSKMRLLCSAALVASLATGVIAGAQAEESDIPNLMSFDFGWQPSSGLNFMSVEGKLEPVGRAPAQPGAERLTDAENTNLKPWAAAQIRTHNELVKNGHRAFSAQSRCWPGGVPGQLLFIAEPIYFVQTPAEVWIIWERDQQVRRVYLNREHSANPKPSWFGESVGHYEDGELVIDTVGFVEHAYSFVDNLTTPHTKDLHVVERWKIVDGGKTLEATVTVDDPGAFNAPWWGKARWQKIDRAIGEWVCAENNLGYEQLFKLPEYPMPVASMPDF